MKMNLFFKHILLTCSIALWAWTTTAVAQGQSSSSQIITGTNLALNKTARQSSRDGRGNLGSADRAVDGNTAGGWKDQSCSMTKMSANPWWEVDLGSVQDIKAINIWNRKEESVRGRLQNFYIMASERPITANSTSQHQYVSGPLSFGDEPARSFMKNTSARYIRIFIPGNEKRLSLVEVQVIKANKSASSSLVTGGSTSVGNINPKVYYKITNKQKGESMGIESSNPRSGIRMARGLTAGMSWVLKLQSNGYYRLYTNWTGDAYSLESNQVGRISVIQPLRNESGQYWKLTPQEDGYLKFSSMFLGQEMALDANGVNGGISMTPWRGKSSQLWKLTGVNRVAQPVEIPPLISTNHSNLTEGVALHDLVPTTGKVKGRILFMQFPDHKEVDNSTETRVNQLIGDNFSQNFFTKQSFGKMELQLDKNSTWRTLPNPKTDYLEEPREPGSPKRSLIEQKVINDARSLFSDVDLDSYDFLVYAFPETDTHFAAYAWVKTKIFFYRGKNSPDGVGGKTFNHEFGHLLGLPDLYRPGNKVFSAPHAMSLGPWDIMDQAPKASGFCGWHRHKMGWLENTRKTYLDAGTWVGTLSSLDGYKSGMSMIVIPDPENCAKVYVIEIAPSFYDTRTDRHVAAEGVLVYSVDANVSTANFPINTITRNTPASNQSVDITRALHTAPFLVGDKTQDMEHLKALELPFSLEVVKKIHNSYRVKVRITRERAENTCEGSR